MAAKLKIEKRTTQESFQQSLVEIGSVVSVEDFFLNFIPPFFYFKLGGHLGWKSGSPPFKIVSVSTVLYPRWPPLLKIEISSNGQNCSILRRMVLVNGTSE
jgi:hypothetical protein